MGIHTMGSQGSGQKSCLQPLARQGSLYSLTLDEVQNQLGDLGKPLGSMNLDELLKNVWSVEANQGLGMDLANAASSGQFARFLDLRRQGSLKLKGALSKKTVDEVWKDIQQGKDDDTGERRVRERQLTLGEMTLEDFLVKAGVVAKAFENKNSTDGDLLNLEEGISTAIIDRMTGLQNFQPQTPWTQYPLPSLHQQQQNVIGVYMSTPSLPQPLGISSGPLMDLSYPDNQVAMSPLMGTLSDPQTRGRKRVAPGDVVEKTVERRQKRMIKNRESAARSRARKQAYTNELENKVSRLEEENERLRKQKICTRLLNFILVMSKSSSLHLQLWGQSALAHLESRTHL